MNEKNLSAIATRNAAYISDSISKNLFPQNAVVVYGLPGEKIRADVPEKTYIQTSNINHLKQFDFTLDENGESRFFVYYTNDQSDLINPTFIASYILLTSADDINREKNIDLVFGDYRASDMAIIFSAYNYTTGAPADGKTPCSVYLLVSPNSNIQHIRIHVENNAVIEGHEKNWADIPLGVDGSATINITSNNSGKSNVKLTAPESSSGDEVNFNIYFFSDSEIANG